jgi:LPXTG-motif cell wall-anchored protein
VFNPALQPTPIPSHTVDNITTSIPPKGGSSSGGSDNGSASGTPTPTPTSTSTGGTDDGNGIPDTGGSGGTLPHTGSDPTDLGLAAVVAFGLGLGLVAAGRRQRPIGRHAHR